MITMRDVNQLRSQRGWPQHMALEYYINLAATTGDTVSHNVQGAYTRHKQGVNRMTDNEFEIKVNTYRSLERVHCMLQDMHQDPDNWADYVDRCLQLVEQIREPYMYLSVYNEE